MGWWWGLEMCGTKMDVHMQREYELMDWSPGPGGLCEMSPNLVVLGGRIWEARGIAW